MSGKLHFYRRTENNDEQPLPIHDNENDDIEMDTMGDEETDAPHEDFNSDVTPPKIVYKRRRREYCYLMWAILTSLVLLVVVILSIEYHQSMRFLHWCCVGNDEMKKCTKMAISFNSERLRPFVTCINSSSIDSCLNLIDQDAADVITLPNSYLYERRRTLQPIMAEDYKGNSGQDQFGTYLVALVQRGDTTINLTYAGLNGKNACVSDVSLLTGYLHNKSIVSHPACNPNNPGPHRSKRRYLPWNVCPPAPSPIFQQCMSLNPGKNAHNDPIKSCLSQKNPFVAFIDHLTMFQHVTGKAENDFQLLCPNGSRAGLRSFKSCHLLWQPSRALVVSNKIRSGADVDVPANAVELLHVAQLYFGSHAPNGSFQMYVSEGPKRDLLFQDSTKKLMPLYNNCTAQNYLGKDYMRYRSAYDCLVVQDNNESCLLPQY